MKILPPLLVTGSQLNTIRRKINTIYIENYTKYVYIKS